MAATMKVPVQRQYTPCPSSAGKSIATTTAGGQQYPGLAMPFGTAAPCWVFQ